MTSQGFVALVTEVCFVITIFGSLTSPEAEAFSSTYSAKLFSANVTQLLDSLLADYDKRIRPGHGGPPTAIAVNMNVRSMGPFSEKQQLYAMQLYLRQIWYDPRLRFNRDVWDRTWFSLNWMFADRLWKPDTFFINGKNSYIHRITAPNMFIRLRYDGQITWSMRLTVRATCLMHLRKFPLDTQHCPLKMASYGYNAQDILYRWDPSKLVTVDSDVSIAQYELVNVSTHMEKVTIRHTEEISTVMVKFHLRRQTGFFLLQVYVPCVLIVCCSWVAFWITKKDVPGRVGLGVTTVLSMTTLGFGGLSTVPPVSYPTALDYFVIVCFAFVFAAVLEFAFINFGERAVNKRRKKMEELRKQIEDRITASSTGGTMMVTTKIEEGKPILKDTLRQVLKVPLMVMPLVDETVTSPGQPDTGDTKGGIKNLMKVSLTVVPDTSKTLKVGEDPTLSGLQIHAGDTMEGYQTLTKVPLVVSPKSAEAMQTSEGQQPPPRFKSHEGGKAWSPIIRSKIKRRKKGDHLRKESSQASENGDKETPAPSIVVDVLDDDEPPPPPPKPVTIWELLMQKRKLMVNMTPTFVIPAEEEILDRFSIVDLYARRIFPSLFFIATALYWILFNYYITDEFADEGLPPSDGLVVTSRL